MSEKNTEVSRNEIMRVSIEEFSKNGFNNTSVRGICRAGGFTNGRFFYYFKDKTDLIHNCVRENYELLSDYINLFKMDIKADLETNSLNLFSHWQDFWRQHPELIFFFVETRISPPNDLRYDFTACRRETFVATLRAKLKDIMSFYYPDDLKKQAFLVGIWLTVLDYVVLGIGLQKVDIYSDRESWLRSQYTMFRKVLTAFLYGIESEQFRAVLE